MEHSRFNYYPPTLEVKFTNNKEKRVRDLTNCNKK